MNFTKEQITAFVITWREFHKEGKHKKKPYELSTVPPQTIYKSDLTFTHHVMYNYFRNLPLERGMKLESDNIAEHLQTIYHSLWWLFNSHHHTQNDTLSAALKSKYENNFNTALSRYTAVFGDELTFEIISDFRSYIKDYKYQKPLT